ncbi:aldo/keto reductase [Scheffersomyces coipomensis]|uniref:aldo/keto reductase n=1 Tax=Scheffersomyces coipomensis TaxID=1788519 RepID=UPI00315C6B99
MTKLSKSTTTFTLNNGVKIPAVGLGTWQASEKGAARNATKVAIENGYRHIDTAAGYQNEGEVGEGIKDSGVPREEIFITTKLTNEDHKRVAAAFEESLKKLDVDYIDLYLVHWPVSTDPVTKKAFEDWDYVDTYKEVQKLYKAGKVKSIGVSNFTINKLERLLSDPEVDVVPAVNQIEAHPFLLQTELFDYLKKKGILIEAYSPLGSTNAPLVQNEVITEVAKKNDVTPTSVLISWAIQRGTVVLPKSVTDSRIIANLETFELSEADFEALNKISGKFGIKRFANPPWNNFDD